VVLDLQQLLETTSSNRREKREQYFDPQLEDLLQRAAKQNLYIKEHRGEHTMESCQLQNTIESYQLQKESKSNKELEVWHNKDIQILAGISSSDKLVQDRSALSQSQQETQFGETWVQDPLVEDLLNRPLGCNEVLLDPPSKLQCSPASRVEADLHQAPSRLSYQEKGKWKESNLDSKRHFGERKCSSAYGSYVVSGKGLLLLGSLSSSARVRVLLLLLQKASKV